MRLTHVHLLVIAAQAVALPAIAVSSEEEDRLFASAVKSCQEGLDPHADVSLGFSSDVRSGRELSIRLAPSPRLTQRVQVNPPELEADPPDPDADPPDPDADPPQPDAPAPIDVFLAEDGATVMFLADPPQPDKPVQIVVVARSTESLRFVDASGNPLHLAPGPAR